MASSQTDASAPQADSSQASRRKRTAVLVVHGIGNQRALDTVRGVVDAVWLQDAADQAPGAPRHQVWTHPEYSGVDIDLSVMTTSKLSVNIPGGHKDRSIDFHELYWAHLMSETRAIAVLLWLFELVRKGPRLKPGLNALWWGTAIFLCLVVLSLVLIGLHAVQLFSGVPCINPSEKGCELSRFLDAPLFVLFAAAISAFLAAVLLNSYKWLLPLLLAAAIGFFLLHFTAGYEIAIDLLLPPVSALLLAGIIMGLWGAGVMLLTWLLSSLLFVLISVNMHWLTGWSMIDHGRVLWSLTDNLSMVIAFLLVFLYLALNAVFLQSYLGDAARYFRASPGNVAVRREIRRQAVDTLEALHTSGNYDRIIVVAHSLGTVVAYDMLRAYFSRICNDLPDPAALGPEVDEIDGMIVKPGDTAAQRPQLRRAAREIIRNIATTRQTASLPAKPAKWLVTDFVTLGSALTHAYYLMCEGKSYDKLMQDFARRVGEREFPTCPPARLDDDGLLLFRNSTTHKKEFHHGAVFGLTRWANLYFPVQQLVWGDAIGGKLSDIFGNFIEDIEVSTHRPPKSAFFTHTEYWNVNGPDGRNAPQIAALQAAVNLEDRPS